MEVAVTVPGGEDTVVETAGDSYGELVEAVGLSTMEAAVLVEGQPVPLDAPVDASEVTVVRLIHGG